ncbi:hypothetical protein E2C01_072561 [Portunus trituberculatus]|uniref:Uncharacterized protein n=1 Tax=Portunus trituberculatus TaxID=210409 RepID=A0A5B7I867_PORTR|nr:hypothetical protein [Portunus trituberculatus]
MKEEKEQDGDYKKSKETKEAVRRDRGKPPEPQPSTRPPSNLAADDVGVRGRGWRGTVNEEKCERYKTS